MVQKPKMLTISLIAVIAGFMIAVLFEVKSNPELRDTRDSWELRAALQKEEEKYTHLMREMRLQEQRLAQYETTDKTTKLKAVRTTLQSLKVEAGYTEKQGEGIILTIRPIVALKPGDLKLQVPALTLLRLVNELNLYGAIDIAIDNERFTERTTIRTIGNKVKINTKSINSSSFEIRVIAKDAEKLYNQIMVSPAIEDFFIENFQVDISQPTTVVLPAAQE